MVYSRPDTVVRVMKYMLAGVCLFLVTVMVGVGEWSVGVSWARSGPSTSGTTMRTIVAYSQEKLAEINKPNPIICDRIPAYPDINYFNHTWSPNTKWHSNSTWQHVPGTKLMLYTAYYDDRLAQHYIRILAMITGRHINIDKQLYCQSRPEITGDHYNTIEATVEVVAAKTLEIWHELWDPYTKEINTPILLSCPLKEPIYNPIIVSVVTETCEDPSNAFHLKPTAHINRTFTICVKDLNFNRDITDKLIEWMEANRIIGVEKIDMYIDKVHKRTEKILDYYRNDGLVRLYHVPRNHDIDGPLWQRRRDHIITYNDCLYRNIRESQFIIPLDIDEIIVPKQVDNLFELLNILQSDGWNASIYASLLVQNVFFFDSLQTNSDIGLIKNKKGKNKNNRLYTKRDDVRIDVNNEVSIINDKTEENLIEKYKIYCGEGKLPRIITHTRRSRKVSALGEYSKSIMVTRNVLTAFNHYPLNLIESTKLTHWFAPFREVQLNHYKEQCNSTVVPECSEYLRRTVTDTTALHLQNLLLQAIIKTTCS